LCWTDLHTHDLLLPIFSIPFTGVFVMPESFGLAHIWTQGDAVTRLILIALIGMSVISWVVIVLKALDVWKHKQSALGSEQFWHTTSLAEGLAVLSHRPENMFHTLAQVGQ
jgi:biopolymer transport protein ExbB